MDEYPDPNYFYDADGASRFPVCQECFARVSHDGMEKHLYWHDGLDLVADMVWDRIGGV